MGGIAFSKRLRGYERWDTGASSTVLAGLHLLFGYKTLESLVLHEGFARHFFECVRTACSATGKQALRGWDGAAS